MDIQVSASFFGPFCIGVIKPQNKVACTGCGKNSSPLFKVFAVFSVTVWNFNLKFYRFIYGNVLHLTAKGNMILLKNDEIIGF